VHSANPAQRASVMHGPWLLVCYLSSEGLPYFIINASTTYDNITIQLICDVEREAIDMNYGTKLHSIACV
jgi:hypothetical protein